MRLVLVLHAHLPWVRSPEPWSCEEGWFHEAQWSCYAPLLAMLEALAAEGIPVPLTVSLSPPLLEMWRDPIATPRFAAHVETLLRLNRLAGPELRAGAEALEAQLEAAAVNGSPGASVKRWAALEGVGGLELWTTAATHALLPLSTGRGAQLAIGEASFRHAFGTAPEGRWLPECAISDEVDAALAAADVSHTVVDEHAVAWASPGPPSLGPILSPRGVAYLPRHREATHRVWSRQHGYPRHPAYREYHLDAAQWLAPERRAPLPNEAMTGLKYHRVTGHEKKALYDPAAGRAQAEADAEDYAAWLEAQPGETLTLAFDAELFGHWWHEGPYFLGRLLRRLAGSERVRLCRARDALMESELAVASPAASSWGRGGSLQPWLNPLTGAMARHALAVRREIDQRLPLATDPRAADEAARAALLLEASDYAFMVNEDRAAGDARRRVEELAESALAWSVAAMGSGPPPPPTHGPFRDEAPGWLAACLTRG
ncbi:MAG: DUF1957 domain-containing protein [Myxococcales bacterium]|nr:DUF1957 domain-containing protein [Myxococcales bacterium]